MHFKVEKIKLHDSGAMKAFIDLAVMNDNQTLCVVQGFKVMDGQNGLWLGVPSTKSGEKWYPSFKFGHDAESGKIMKAEAEEAAISAYKLESGQGEGPDDIAF